MSVVLSEEFLRQIEGLALVTRRSVAGHLRGHHRSRRTGVGMVFTDYRPYSPGDDTRNLDWGTYLRLDRLILRLFEEEADLPIYIFVDVSKSMGVGEPAKLEFACRFAAALAYLGLVNHDRVSLIAFADGVLSEMPARRGKNQMWRTMHFLERLTPGGSTSLQNAFRKFFGARRTRGLVLVASDFLDQAGFEPAFQVIRRFGHEVFAAHIVSPEDREPPFGDDVVLVDAEDGSSLKAHLTPELLESYRDGFAKYCSEIEAFCRGHGWGYLRADTDAPFEQLILRALRYEGLLR